MGERTLGAARRGPRGRVLVGAIALLAALGLTSAAARQASTAVPGLVAAYAFSEGSGTTVADLSGNGNTGTLVNAAWTTTGKYGNALTFNGTSSRVDIPDAASLHLSSAFTLEAWVKPSNQSGWRDVIYKGSDRYYLEASSTPANRPAAGGTFGTTTANAFGTATLTNGTWTHLAATYDGSAVRLYVNGALVATQAATGSISSSTNPLQIGGDSLFSKQYYTGTIDEVRVYNVALSAASIQTDMSTPIDTGSSDTQPPSAPGTLTATASGTAQVNLSWGAATDNVGVTGYLVERCQGAACSSFTQVGTATGTTFSDTGLTAGTSYSYRVRATDAAGNLGAYSNVATATTGTGGDTQPPSAPGTLIATPISTSQINLSWGAATDNVGVTGYLVERCQGAGCSSFAQIGTPTGTTFSDGGLTAGTSYSYRVRATDAAGNLGPYSNVATTTTNSGTSPTLEAAYAFSEGAGSTVADLSGNGNTGTLVNAAWTTAGKYGNALSLNGTSARVDIADSPSLRLTNGMTLEAWVDPAASPSAWKDLIYKGNDNYYLEGSSTTSGVPAGGGTFGGAHANAFGTAALATNVWTHVALTYDGANIRLYVNGALVATQAKTGLIATSANALSIGGDSIYGQYFKGSIDEVRVYNGALAAAAIQTDMATPIDNGSSGDTQPPSAPGTLTAAANGSNEIDLSWGAATDNVGVTGYAVNRCPGSGCTNFAQIAVATGTTYADTGLAPATTYTYQVLAMDAAGNRGPASNTASATTGASTLPTPVAAYGFEEGSGTTTADASGNGNTATLVNATWTTAGKFGNALSFNGTNARLDIADAPSLHLSTAMTLEAWVDPTSVTAKWRDVVYKGPDAVYLEGTSTGGTGPVAGATIGGTGTEAKGPTVLTAGTWTHLAETYDGATLRLYVNGTQVASTAKTGTIAASTSPLQIGGDSVYSQFFSGTIDEVRVYNTALTAAQIQTDMNTAVGAGGPSAPANLAASAASPTEIDLTWGASTAPAGVTGYQVERCQGVGCSTFAQIATPSGTSYQDTTVSANTTYSYRVRAVDGGGKLSPYSNVATAFTGLTVSPRAVALTPGEQQQYTATAPGGGAATVTWSVDGVAGGNSTTGTITTGGLYTAPQAPGPHTVTATQQAGAATGSATAYATNLPGVFTYHYDNMRDGLNANETVLTPANVSSSSFGKLFSLPLDGLSFSSPLYVENVNIPGQGVHNVVYVATEHDSIYAFDADGRTSTPLWKDSFINPAAGVTPIPPADTGETQDIPNEIGITGTPVIDQATGTLYLVAATKEVSGGTTTYVNRLHALDIATGAERPGSPVVINPTVPGTAPDAVGGMVPFDNVTENQRAALTITNGQVVVAFANHGNNPPYHGWVMGYDETTLVQDWVFCSTPNAGKGGVWMGGAGLAVDGSGSIYFSTGNGTFDQNTGGGDFGDTLVKLSATGAVSDWFTPYNYAALDSGDVDLASGGVLLLPDQAGTHPHEALAAGKGGTIYVVDRDSLGHVGTTNDNQIVQSLINVFPTGGSFNTGNYSAPVYFNGAVFYAPVAGALMRFGITNGLLTTSPTSQSPEIYNGKTSTFSPRGGTISASANGTSNGILWALQSNGDTSPGTLHAYNPANLAQEYYTSDQAGTRDQLDPWLKFTTPVVANGHVYVVSSGHLTAYGLLP